MPKNTDSPTASVLLVDDESSIRESLRMILEYEGYQVDEAGSGPQALARIADKAPDAVILDVKMPEMDGLAVLSAFRERGYEMPVLIISGHGDVKHRRRRHPPRGLRLLREAPPARPRAGEFAQRHR